MCPATLKMFLCNFFITFVANYLNFYDLLFIFLLFVFNFYFILMSNFAKARNDNIYLYVQILILT